MRLEAIIRNFEIIDVAVRNIPQQIKDKYTSIDWRRLADFRSVLAHEYFGVNYKILWDIIKSRLPELEEQLETILKSEP